MQYTYFQVKHTKSQGDVIGQALTFNSVDAYLLEYFSQMKNAINNEDVIGMDIMVADNQLNTPLRKSWTREVVPQEEQPQEQGE